MKVPLTDLSFVYVLMFGTIVYVSLFIVLQERDRARAQVEALLMNTLPREIVERLNREERSVSLAVEPELADEFPAVTVLFADIVGFTSLSADIKPGELVTILNDIFTRFDGLADEYGVEKIKTIGDAYMAVSGVPTPVPDHAPRIAGMALAMVRTIEEYCKQSGHSLEIRVGVNTGPVVAGVIGQRRFVYDLWGDTVNLASRMESHGKPSAVQISDATAEALDGAFLVEDRGGIEVKGKGLVHAWWLVGEKGAS
jgi:class 3 adenylate cyclase